MICHQNFSLTKFKKNKCAPVGALLVVYPPGRLACLRDLRQIRGWPRWQGAGSASGWVVMRQWTVVAAGKAGVDHCGVGRAADEPAVDHSGVGGDHAGMLWCAGRKGPWVG